MFIFTLSFLHPRERGRHIPLQLLLLARRHAARHAAQLLRQRVVRPPQLLVLLPQCLRWRGIESVLVHVPEAIRQGLGGQNTERNRR